MNADTTYRHTQHAWICWLIAATSIPAFVTAAMVWQEPGGALLIAAAGLMLLYLAGAFGQLSVADDDDALLIAFGPLPLFWRRIPYAKMRAASVARTTFWDGWGIHWSLRGGWVWNLWGYDCVEIQLDRGKVFVGTDQPKLLSEFLQSRIAETPAT